jgi:hypothetical protein
MAIIPHAEYKSFIIRTGEDAERVANPGFSLPSSLAKAIADQRSQGQRQKQDRAAPVEEDPQGLPGTPRGANGHANLGT